MSNTNNMITKSSTIEHVKDVGRRRLLWMLDESDDCITVRTAHNGVFVSRTAFLANGIDMTGKLADDRLLPLGQTRGVLNAQLQAAQAEVATLNDLLASKQKKIDELLNIEQRLLGEIEQQHEQRMNYAAVCTHRDTLEGELDKVIAQLTQAAAEYTAMVADRESADERLRNLDCELQHAYYERDEAWSELAGLRSAVAQLTKRVEDERANGQDLVTRFGLLKAAYDTLHQMYAEQQATIGRQAAELVQLHKDYETKYEQAIASRQSVERQLDNVEAIISEDCNRYGRCAHLDATPAPVCAWCGTNCNKPV